jgi:ferritin-like metal-binding protein YciE
MSAKVSFASQNMTDAAKSNAEKSASAVADNMKKIFDFSMSEKIEARIQELQSFADRGAKIGEGIVNKNREQINAMNDAMKKMYGIIQNGIVNGIANSFSALGAALAKGKNGFEAFSKAVISSLGALAIQMGSMLVAIGLGFEALGPVMPVWGLSGGKAVAAGIGLIALGGAMQALGGGGESSASGGGGGGGGGGGAAATPEMAKPEQMEKKKADIIINGDFLNTRETANHLAEILRENSDITDYTITAQGKAYA